MRRPRALAAAAFVLVAATRTGGAAAQAQSTTPVGVPSSTEGGGPPASLRERVGVDDAARLLRSNDPDERLRGVEQAASMHSSEALALLERAAGTDSSHGLDPHMPTDGIARTDPRAVLAVVRGLADWADREEARAALASLVSAPNESFAFRVGTLPDHEGGKADVDDAARVMLARREAAIALAGSGSTLAIEALIAMARGAGPGRAAAIDALAVHPPSAPVALGGVVLTTPAMVALAADVGDLRTLDSVLGAARASDPALRAAAIDALSACADTRVLDAARAALHDDGTDAGGPVRVAAVRALVRLGAREAPQAVTTLVDADATAAEGLTLARNIQDEDVTRAVAARAGASSGPELRAQAIVTLGRQSAPSAVRALAALLVDPRFGGDAAAAIAHSPSSAALDALEALDDPSAGGEAAARRRLAARAYFVRRFTRGDRSARLDALLGAMAASADAGDRSVGLLALIALGERPTETALKDVDRRVRVAGALAATAVATPSGDERLLERMAIEPDARVRAMLAFGWAGARVDRSSLSTTALVDRATAGGPDAPLAAFALGRRTEERARAAVDTLLGSSNPLLRAHAARGLGASARADAAERLSRAYVWEADAFVRRAVVEALAARTGDPSPARARTLALAARLDPDREARWTAEQGLTDRPLGGTAPAREVLWIRLTPAEGATLPTDARGFFVRSDGLAIPVAFDDEGFALVPGVPPGEGRLQLAPGDQPYSASAP